MNRRQWLTAMSSWALMSAAAGRSFAAGRRKPNVVFFLVDDLGWADLGCYGSTFHETPNIDNLSTQGMKFTNAYTACPVCSPTRASIMTGRHPVRVDITDWIPGMRADKQKLVMPQDRSELALEETTIAEALKKGGYQTFYAGKWHLGKNGFGPKEQGFDIYIDESIAGNPKKDPLVSDRYTDESIEFLEKRDPAKPFILYLSYNKVHTPILRYPKHIGRYEKKAAALSPAKRNATPEHDGQTRARQNNAAYGSEVSAVDDSVGRILDKLDELRLADDTVVIFFSDNGGLSTKAKPGPTCNLPLRAGKGWLYEGGIRVPLIVRAPGITKAGRVCDEPVVSMDFFPTILEMAGLSPMPEQHADGVSLKPLLRGSRALDREALYWHYPHYHGSTWKPGAAIRDGDWKLIEFYHYEKVELYNLREDLGERNDLSKTMPEKKKELLGKLHAWQKQLGAKMPRPRSGAQ